MTLANIVMEHAGDNWNDGWDIIYEAWSLDEIAAELDKNNIVTKRAAIRHFQDHVELVAGCDRWGTGPGWYN